MCQIWVPLTVGTGTHIPITMSGIPSKFGTMLRSGGVHQLTYNRAPLYTFVKDKKPGDLTGEGLYALGGYWWAVETAAHTGTSSTSSGSGY